MKQTSSTRTHIEFTENYEDLSTDQGYQFRFYCERCDRDYTSQFQPHLADTDDLLLESVGSLFAEAGDNGQEVQPGAGEPEHDSALQTAATEVREHFHQCPVCGEWVCERCWNDAMMMCEKCAPTNGTVDEEQAQEAQEPADEPAMVVCEHCGEEVPQGTFCSNCGWPLNDED